MEVVLILTGALLAVGVPLWWLDRRHLRRQAQTTPESAADDTDQGQSEDEECCGMHATCERDSLLASVSKGIEYYDDEELDRFRGRASDSYSREEAEEFRDVLLTLLPDDIAGWARSMQLRGVALPDDVRDELIMIVGEARASRTHTTHA